MRAASSVHCGCQQDCHRSMLTSLFHHRLLSPLPDCLDPALHIPVCPAPQCRPLLHRHLVSRHSVLAVIRHPVACEAVAETDRRHRVRQRHPDSCAGTGRFCLPSCSLTVELSRALRVPCQHRRLVVDVVQAEALRVAVSPPAAASRQQSGEGSDTVRLQRAAESAHGCSGRCALTRSCPAATRRSSRCRSTPSSTARCT